jgi:hypothetical protein
VRKRVTVIEKYPTFMREPVQEQFPVPGSLGAGGEGLIPRNSTALSGRGRGAVGKMIAVVV